MLAPLLTALVLSAAPRALTPDEVLGEALRHAVVAAELASLLDAGPESDGCGGAPFCPLQLRPIAAVPHLDLAVIRLGADGRALQAAEVIFDPASPAGRVVRLGPDLAPRGVRFRRWSPERREAPGAARPFVAADDLAPGLPPGGRDFMEPYPASLFKVLVAFHVARRAAEGALSLDEWLPDAFAPEQAPRPASEWLDRMMTRSDNGATRALLRWLHGRGEVERMNREFAALGLRTLRIDGTRPEDGARWAPGEVHAGAMDVARLLWIVAGGPGVHWRTPEGRRVTSAVLPEGARDLLKVLLAEQASHNILSSGSVCGVGPTGIPALVPDRWLDPATGTEAAVEPAWRRDVRPCNAAAEVRFLHKTGVTWNFAADAGIVESLPGAPCRRYVVAMVSSAGTRFLDPESGDLSLHPCPREGLCVPRRLAEIGGWIDRWMVGASAEDRTGAGCPASASP
jgi:hypothetical protein